ncbi:MAG: SRPBCC domain-containing protein [Nitrospinae bacterium]|nr:SRPBCC domain-containing protein [Nitrospinota bacterium]
MASTTAILSPVRGRELVITRILDAPRDLVFKAWTDRERLLRWWAPKGFTTPSVSVDLRPGGSFNYCMRSPEGRDFWGKGQYQEIIKPLLIIYMDSFTDEKGNTVPASYYGMNPDFPQETLVTVRFIEEPGKTRLTLRHTVIGAAEELEAMRQGWNEMLDRLEELVTKG